jgi:hypothetical protein
MKLHHLRLRGIIEAFPNEVHFDFNSLVCSRWLTKPSTRCAGLWILADSTKSSLSAIRHWFGGSGTEFWK